MRNPLDRLVRGPDGMGVACDWEFTRTLRFCDVFPRAGKWLLARSLREWPIRLSGSPEQVSAEKVCHNGGTGGGAAVPEASILIGHRGEGRLPSLLLTLKSLAAQQGLPFECIVVEQDVLPLIRDRLPGWVRYVHTPIPNSDMPYCRSWALNVAAAHARAPLLVFHDNDMLVPLQYAVALRERFVKGYEVINLKRFIFYLAESCAPVARVLAGKGPVALDAVLENLEAGGSIAMGREAFEGIGGFDEKFVGWGGEDTEFWDRCLTRRTWDWTFLPMLHLWHPAQAGKRSVNGQGQLTASLTDERRAIPAAERIAELVRRVRGRHDTPPGGRSPSIAAAASLVASSHGIGNGPEPMMPGVVSTIIPVRNRPRLLRLAVQSVLSQTFRPIEILIVDDGSTDDTRDVADLLALEHPETIRVIAGPGKGPGPAREAGRRMARGEFIQYLDSDDRLDSQKFERQVALLREQPDVDVVYGTTRLVDSDGNILEPVLKWSGEERPSLFPGLLVDRWWSTHSPLWRRTLCDRIGPWSALRYSEDWEYEARAGALKARLARVPVVVCDVCQHDGPRETRAASWLSPRDQVDFFQTLHACALQAGVLPLCPEMQHFVRWIFAAARSAGHAGDPDSASQLLALAKWAHGGESFVLSAYGALARVIGWKIAYTVTEGARRLAGRKPGRKTLLQSWMKPEKPHA